VLVLIIMKETSCDHVSTSERLPRQSCLNLKSTKNVVIGNKKDKLILRPPAC